MTLGSPLERRAPGEWLVPFLEALALGSLSLPSSDRSLLTGSSRTGPLCCHFQKVVLPRLPMVPPTCCLSPSGTITQVGTSLFLSLPPSLCLLSWVTDRYSGELVHFKKVDGKGSERRRGGRVE